MTDESPALVRTFQVGRRRCTWTVAQPKRGEVVRSVVEWEPDVPRRLCRRQLRQYRAGRDAAFAELCRRAGLNGMMIET